MNNMRKRRWERHKVRELWIVSMASSETEIYVVLHMVLLWDEENSSL